MLNQKPCDVCPYKLGIVKMIISPCPQCQKCGYDFLKQLEHQKENPLTTENKEKMN